MAAEEGFEPSHTESESAVLPLHNSAILFHNVIIIPYFFDLSILFFIFYLLFFCFLFSLKKINKIYLPLSPYKGQEQ